MASASARLGPTTVRLARSVGVRISRVMDVLAAFVRAGGRDGQVADGEDRHQCVGMIGMADTDPPGETGLGPAPSDDVAAGVDGVGGRARSLEVEGGLFYGPTLDVA